MARIMNEVLFKRSLGISMTVGGLQVTGLISEEGRTHVGICITTHGIDNMKVSIFDAINSDSMDVKSSETSATWL